MIKEAPGDVAEAYKIFIEESKNIATVQDLDFLFVKLKGTGAEELIKEIEEDAAAAEEEKS
jgi:hypothetical protein